MGQYGNQPDFGTKGIAITPSGFAGGQYVNVLYQNYEGAKANIYLTSKNLNVSTFTDGTEIVQALSGDDWQTYYDNSTPCWAYANYAKNDIYGFGKIYNRFAVENPALYSNGYGLILNDTAREFTTDYGYNEELGYKLKSTLTAARKQNPSGIMWPEDQGGINQFNFTGLPGGDISEYDYINQNYKTKFWTDNTSDGIFWGLSAENHNVLCDSSHNYNGYYVRLVVYPADPNYTAPQPLGSAALYVGTGGDLVVSIVGSEEPVIFRNVADGSFLPIIVTNVWERGDMGITTASDIIALY